VRRERRGDAGADAAGGADDEDVASGEEVGREGQGDGSVGPDVIESPGCGGFDTVER